MTFQTRIGNVCITTTLYGDISSDRVVRERMIAAHRAEQLGPFKRQERKLSFEDRMGLEDDHVEDDMHYGFTPAGF